MDAFTILNGTFSIIYVFISILVGGTMIAAYFKNKEKLLLLVGLTWIGLVMPWYPSSVSFIVALFNNGVGISEIAYYLIGNVAAPIFILIWLMAFTEFFFIEKRKYILVGGLVYAILFEAIFLALLILNPSGISDFEPPINVDYKGLYLILALSVIVIISTTGLYFSYRSIKTEKKKTRIKGYFLLAAFVSYTIGAILDAAIARDYLLLIIARIILITGAIEWYFGFIMPKFLQKRLE
ncbi:MAG: hypothetical protein EU543_02595 [Promethearchaeota archaeon]|nr:MAG: hypothetical protein EU543_02595 [Candidatus Lokiarchaeota archaeon]